MVNFRRLLMVVALVAICSSMAMAVTNFWNAGSTTVTNNIPTILRQEGITETLAPKGIGFTIGQYVSAAEADGTYNITLYFTGEQCAVHVVQRRREQEPRNPVAGPELAGCLSRTASANGTSGSCPAVTLTGRLYRPG